MSRGSFLPASRLLRTLAAVATLPVVVLGVGFVFHTALDPDVFGKYTWGYFAFLCVWWLVVTPAAWLFWGFVFKTHRIELSTGTVWHVRPSLKLLLVLVLGGALTQFVAYRVHKALGRGVTTSQGSDAFHPFLQNDPQPNNAGMGTNRWGFRGHDIEKAKPPDAYRIFVLGGSTVFSGPITVPSTHVEVLGRILREAHPGTPIEVQNAGAEWHCSEHSLIKLLTRIQTFEPDLVIVWHAINDLYRSFVPETFAVPPYRDDYAHFHGAASNLVRPAGTTLQLVRMKLGYWFSDYRYDRVRVVGPTGDGVNGLTQMFFPKAEAVDVTSWPSLSAYERNMTDLVRACRERDIDVILASQPSLYREDLTPSERERIWFPHAHQQEGRRPTVASMQAGMQQFNSVTRALASKHDVGFVDLDAVLPKTVEHLYDDVHYTEQGCLVIGRALAEHVRGNDMIVKRLRARQSDEDH